MENLDLIICPSGEAAVVSQVVGFPVPTWDTWIEFKALGFTSPGHFRHLGSESVHENSPLSSLSMPRSGK